LSLSYSSSRGHGPFGLGWSLGVPSISRKTDRGWPRYREARGEDNVFIMAGAEDLVPQLERDRASGLFKQDANGAYRPKETTINGYRVRQYVPRVD
jgi:hypothetical protein